MTNYGPPLRFKAVDTENGDVIDPIVVDAFCSFRKHDKNLIMIKEGYSLGSFWPKCQIYQSTGHTDENGVEVFFGDVLADKHGAYWVVKMIFGVVRLCNVEKEGYWNANLNDLLSEGCNLKFFNIGNAHTPQAELQRRAEGVRGDLFSTK